MFRRKAMPILVTPEGTIQRIADKAALGKYAEARSAAGHQVNGKLKGNWRSCWASIWLDRTEASAGKLLMVTVGFTISMTSRGSTTQAYQLLCLSLAS